MKGNEMCMSYPAALGKEFRELCVKEGYVYQKRPSPKRFFEDLISGEWVRLPVASNPPVRHREYPGGQTAVTVSLKAYGVLSKRGTLYKTFGHMVQDIIAGNWVRRSTKRLIGLAPYDEQDEYFEHEE